MLAFGVRQGAALRLFSGSAVRAASPKSGRGLSKTEMNKRMKQKMEPQAHPLYMTIPQAMRYMRAAEVGRPAARTTVSLQIVVLPEKGSQPLRGLIDFPKPLKQNHSLVFTTNEATANTIRELGFAGTVGGEELIKEIKAGRLLNEYTQAFATPEIVSQLGPVARLLGPKGLMPSAKKGTVLDDVVTLLRNSAAAFNFKEKNNQLNFPVGRCDFSDEEIIRNIQAASKVVYGLQPAGTKNPSTLGLCSMSSTQGPSVVIDFRS